MPGCIRMVAGADFDVDAFLRDSTLQPYKIWHRGDMITKVGRLKGKQQTRSGFCFKASEVDGELRGQIADTILFLASHRHDFESIASLPTIEICQLEFGYVCRLSGEVGMQGENLPVQLLSLVGQWRIAFALSLYPEPESDSTVNPESERLQP